MKLSDVANVRSGLVLGRKQSNVPTEYRYPLLNLRAIREDGELDLEQIETLYTAEALNPEYLTHKGDIVVRMTPPFSATLIEEETEGMVIPSSFIIVRVFAEWMMPEYIFWLLNTKQLRNEAAGNSTNNVFGGTKPSYYRDLHIPKTSPADQMKIVKLNELARKECHLMHRLAEEKNRYYTALMNQMQNDMNRSNQHD